VGIKAGLLAIGAGVGIGIAALGCGIGQGKLGASAMESIGRNPNSTNQLFVPMIIGLAFIESLTLYALVIAFILQAKI
jgi:F-type H+-transporting ATPase subunit c